MYPQIPAGIDHTNKNHAWRKNVIWIKYGNMMINADRHSS